MKVRIELRSGTVGMGVRFGPGTVRFGRGGGI